MIHTIFREHIYKRFFRSSQWPKFRKMVIAKHPYCAVCGGTLDLEVHHIIPVSQAPMLELVESNTIVLCRPKRCHLTFGHLNNWKHYNPYIVFDAYQWYQRITGTIDKLSMVYRRSQLHVPYI